MIARLALHISLFIAALVPGAGAVAVPAAPVVLAAASLQESLTEAADAYARRGHLRPVLSFASSSALAHQIEAGAPADLFLSADEPWMDFLAGKKLIRKGTRTSFLSNRLVLITPKAKPLKIRIAPKFPLAKAIGDSRLAMGEPNSVPAGKYGKAALTTLGVWRDVASKVAGTENVRAALQLVSRGEARAGIVYETDAMASKNVTVAGVFPAHSHPPITYPIAIVATSQNPEASSFRAFLLSSAGKAIFRRYGFGTK